MGRKNNRKNRKGRDEGGAEEVRHGDIRVLAFVNVTTIEPCARRNSEKMNTERAPRKASNTRRKGGAISALFLQFLMERRAFGAFADK